MGRELISVRLRDGIAIVTSAKAIGHRNFLATCGSMY
jgi:hypothetical protein